MYRTSSVSPQVVGGRGPGDRPLHHLVLAAGLELQAVHELSIAVALVGQVEEVQSSQGGGPVVSVGLRIGTWRLVVPESLTFYYVALTRGTPLEGSRLEIETVAARARCQQCGEVFAVEEAWVVCPISASLGSDLLCGQELDLVSVELED
jgi:hydrogenase nickel incorporation protein HypA/HybF